LPDSTPFGFLIGIFLRRERGEKRNKAAANSKPNGLIPARLFMAVLPTVYELHFLPGFGVTHDFFFHHKMRLHQVHLFSKPLKFGSVDFHWQ